MARPPITERVPFEPLYRASGARSLAHFARMVGRSYRLVWNWRRAGTVTVWTADRYAAALNLHPSEVWPEWGRG